MQSAKQCLARCLRAETAADHARCAACKQDCWLHIALSPKKVSPQTGRSDPCWAAASARSARWHRGNTSTRPAGSRSTRPGCRSRPCAVVEQRRRNLNLSDLTPHQHQALQLIASGLSQRQAAKSVGVSPQTMCAWSQLPAFREQVHAIIGDAHQATATMLMGQRLRAVEVLGALLESASSAVKLQAVKMVLEVTSQPPPAHTAPVGDEFAAVMQLLQEKPDASPPDLYQLCSIEALAT